MGRKAKRAMELCRTKKGGIVRDGKRPAAEGSGEDGEADSYYATAAGNGLPMANLVRLMRQVVPADVKISTRAKRLTHDCAVEFVGFVSGEAPLCATAQHRRTIAPEDFTRSFRTLGLDDYVGPLSTYIRRYRENQNASGACSFAAPPRAASASFSDEEVQFLMSVVPEPDGGYYDGAASSSPPPAK